MYSMCTPSKYSFSPFSGFPVKDFNHYVVRMGGVGSVGGKSGESRFHTSGSRPKFINLPSCSIDFILLTSSKSKGPKITFPKKILEMTATRVGNSNLPNRLCPNPTKLAKTYSCDIRNYFYIFLTFRKYVKIGTNIDLLDLPRFELSRLCLL